MNGRIHQYVIIIILIAMSLLSLTPARADQQVLKQEGTVTFHLTGQATAIGDTGGLSGSTTLDLIGGVHEDGNGGLIVQNLTGTLQVNSDNYPISGGHGNSNRLGEFVLFGESRSGELILHGIILKNFTVTVGSPASRLSSLAYLTLSGNITVIQNGSTMSEMPTQNITSTGEMQSASANVNSTSEIMSLESSTTANITSSTVVSLTNVTESQVVAQTNASITTPNQTASNALLIQTNSTETSTELSSQPITVYVTQTVANYTITQTSTTVANVTITQFTSVTVANVTVTVTNSTTSGP